MKQFSTFHVLPNVPEELAFLEVLSRNLWWSWKPRAIELFRRIDPKRWKQSGRNPQTFLSMVPTGRLSQLAKDDGFLGEQALVKKEFETMMGSGEIRSDGNFPKSEVVAYLSMEFGLHETIPTFAGGLGILAGDHLKAASGLETPLVGVGLLFNQGYFQQFLNPDGYQQEKYPEIDLYHLPLSTARDNTGAPIKITVPFPERDIYAVAWRVQIGRTPLFLLDTDLQENSPDVRNLTARLYSGGPRMRLAQEVLLGIGGIRALDALGLHAKVCHMNEGHSAFSSLERLAQEMQRHQMCLKTALEVIPRTTIFTTHTPVTAGHDEFSVDMVRPFLAPYEKFLDVDIDEILKWGQHPGTAPDGHFSMSIFGLRMAQGANGVSKLHGKVARRMWAHLWYNRPVEEVPIRHITNGVHLPTWLSPENAQLYERHLGPNWYLGSRKPENIDRITDIYDEDLWRAHESSRARLIRICRTLLAKQYRQRNAPKKIIEDAESVLDADCLTIGFARRFATYKRAYLFLMDEERLIRLLTNNQRPIQIVVAGKAHPKDNEGKDMIRRIVLFARKAEIRHRMVFLENYDMHIARLMLQGVDVWLNTPRRPFEACGTSGMKAAMNGVLNFSVLDGWWAEAFNDAYGWALGDGSTFDDPGYQDTVESRDLYNVLEEDIIPAFYNRKNGDVPIGWLQMMKASMKMSMEKFCAHRMVDDYRNGYYYPAADRYDKLVADGAVEARRLCKLSERYHENWERIRIGVPKRTHSGNCHVGDDFRVTVGIHLGDFSPAEISVQLFYGKLKSGDTVDSGQYAEMVMIENRENGDFVYESLLTCEYAGRFGFTVRALPAADEWIQNQPGLITWTNV